jgi:hypothetical protein
MDGRTDGRMNRQTKTKKERKEGRKTDGRTEALSSHCPGRNLRMFVTDRQTPHLLCDRNEVQRQVRLISGP